METRKDEREANENVGAGPRVRPARIFRTIVLCALAAAPAACGPRAAPDDPQGHVYRGGPDAAAEAEPIVTPDYAVEPGPVPAYGVEPYPEPMPEYAAPAPDEPVAVYAVPAPVDDPGMVPEYMAPMPQD